MSFWGGFSKGFDWGYKTTGQVLARNRLKELQDQKIEDNFVETGPLADPIQTQQQETIAQLAPNTIDADGNVVPKTVPSAAGLSSPVPTDNALLNKLGANTGGFTQDSYNAALDESAAAAQRVDEAQATRHELGEIDRWNREMGAYESANRAYADNVFAGQGGGISSLEARLNPNQSISTANATRGGPPVPPRPISEYQGEPTKPAPVRLPPSLQKGNTAYQGDVKPQQSKNASFKKDGYNFLGKHYKERPSAYQERAIRQNAIADIYEQYGMLPQAQQARQSAFAAEAMGLQHQDSQRRLGMEEERLGMEQKRLGMAEEAQTSRLKTEKLQRTATQLGIDLNNLKKSELEDVNKINRLYFDFLAGDGKSLDGILERAMPLYNQNKEDNHQLVKKPDGMYVQFEGKDGKPGEIVRASEYLSSLSQQERSSLLEWSHRYAIAARTGRYDDLDNLRKNTMMADYYKSKGVPSNKLSTYMEKLQTLMNADHLLSPTEYALTMDGVFQDPDLRSQAYDDYVTRFRLNQRKRGREGGGPTLGEEAAASGGLGGPVKGSVNAVDAFADKTGQFSDDIIKGLGRIPDVLEGNAQWGRDNRAGKLDPVEGNLSSELSDPRVVMGRLTQIEERLATHDLDARQRATLRRLHEQYSAAAQRFYNRALQQNRLPYLRQNTERFLELSGQ